MTSITEYVAGFLFSLDEKQVLLIKKNRPDWQAGCLNGIGGHIEKGEGPKEAMQREFKEETGLDIYAWNKAVDLYGNGWLVHFFYAHGNLQHAQSMTDEEVNIYDTQEVITRSALTVIPNLRYLIPLCLDKDITKPVMVTEKVKEPL